MSKERREQLMSSVARRASCLLATVWVMGCRSEYSLEPTLCDDFCRAVQRGGCAEDLPARCVRECELTESSQAREACREQWLGIDACLLAVDANLFVCENERSRVPDGVCLAERRDLLDCYAPGSAACFDECLRQAEACGVPLSDCELNCRYPTPGCEAQHRLYSECVLTAPVECRDFFQPDTRAPEDIPCFYEALGLLDCVK